MFVYVDVDSELAQAKRGRESADTVANDGNGRAVLMHKGLPNEIREIAVQRPGLRESVRSIMALL